MTKAPIAVLVKTYPKLSETFVLGEVLGLEKLGLDLHLFALRRPTDSVQHEAIARVRAPVDYLNQGNLLAVCASILDSVITLCTSPVQYMRAMRFLARRNETGRVQDLLIASTLVRKLRRAGIAHVHAHFATQPVAVAELAARLAGISFSISAHAKDIYLSDPAVLARKMGNARFTVTCTDYNRRYLAGIAAPGSAVYGMYHGIDAAKFAPCDDEACAKHASPDARSVSGHTQPASLPSPAEREGVQRHQRKSEQASLSPGHNEHKSEHPPLILAVGRLREKKGFATLVRACARLHKAGTAFRCEIVGYGEERERLQAMIAESGLSDRVQLLGTMNHSALIERYRAAAIFAAPCQVAADGDRDGIPNVMLEAMAMQLAVVATPVSGIPEVIAEGVNGVLVEPENPAALAAALQRLLADAPLRAQLGRAARTLVLQQFDHDRNLLLLKELLLQAPQRAAVTEVERAYA